MIYLELFLTFLKIGAVSFGGGYGMLALMREEVVSHGWITEEIFIDYIAVAESTPGPIAVNMATLVGSGQAGIVGALLATLGVVLPAFLIMLCIVALIRGFLKYKAVRMTVDGIKPVVIALILVTGLTMALSVIFGITTWKGGFSFDWKSLVIFLIVAAVSFVYSLKKKKSFSPILTILICAGLGMLFYGAL